jgi:hypothetical protein
MKTTKTTHCLFAIIALSLIWIALEPDHDVRGDTASAQSPSVSLSQWCRSLGKNARTPDRTSSDSVSNRGSQLVADLLEELGNVVVDTHFRMW